MYVRICVGVVDGCVHACVCVCVSGLLSIAGDQRPRAMLLWKPTEALPEDAGMLQPHHPLHSLPCFRGVTLRALLSEYFRSTAEDC